MEIGQSHGPAEPTSDEPRDPNPPPPLIGRLPASIPRRDPPEPRFAQRIGGFAAPDSALRTLARVVLAQGGDVRPVPGVDVSFAGALLNTSA